MRRHLEGAHLQEPQPPARGVGRVQLVDAEFGAMRVAGDVDQQIAQQPVDEPGRRTSPGAGNCLNAISSS